MNEQYLDALYCVKEKVEKTVAAYADRVAKVEKLDDTMLKYGDTLMHFAKNLSKEIWCEEGGNEFGEEFTGYNGGNQADGRAIRSTPGYSMEGDSYRGSSMIGGQSYRGSYRGGYSSRRDSRGRFTSSNGSYNNGYSGHDDQEGTIAKLRKMADMTTNHDEREIMLNMIERLKNEG